MTAFADHWPADTADHNHVAWVRDAWNSVRPFPKGGNYLSFPTAADDDERVGATYRTSFERASSSSRRTTNRRTCSARTGTSLLETQSGKAG